MYVVHDLNIEYTTEKCCHYTIWKRGGWGETWQKNRQTCSQRDERDASTPNPSSLGEGFKGKTNFLGRCMYTLSKGRGEKKKRFKTCFRNFSLCSLHEEMQTSNKAPGCPTHSSFKAQSTSEQLRGAFNWIQIRSEAWRHPAQCQVQCLDSNVQRACSVAAFALFNVIKIFLMLRELLGR